MTTVLFSDPDLAKAVEALSDEQKHELPFGAIKLDENGVVTFFNATEATKSGYKKRPAVGLDFFLKVAPCMDTPEFKGRIDEARRHGAVDIEMGWVGDFDDPNREMVVRIYSASDGGFWIFLNREDDGA